VVVTRHSKIAPRGRLTLGRFTLPSAIAEQIEVRSPLNPSDVVAVFPCGEEDVDDAVESASGAAAAWSATPYATRARLLERVAEMLAPLGVELSVRMQRELGRPPWECARELAGLRPRVLDVLALGREHLGDFATHGDVRVERRALGVVAVLGPVMLPLASSHGAIIAALAAGNTVVYKPSPLACTSAQLYAQAFVAAGLPPGVFNLVQGGAAVGARLLAHPGTDGAVFIGTRENARAIRRATADRLELKTILHVGAKNPAVVLDDADVATTVSELMQGAFATAGQRCTAISRVLVQASIVEPFLDELQQACARLDVGRPSAQAAYGPMFSRARLERFLERTTEAEADGAMAILPAEARGACWLRPSIHLVEDRARAVRYRDEELFGPDLMVEPIDDLDGAIARLRGSGGLYASLFSQVRGHWLRFSREVCSGALLWNHAPTSVSARVPFAAPGREAASRGVQALVSLTRETAKCSAATAPGLPLVAGARADEPELEAVGS
jgi:succinylglutamic semialdehyde dehydrogenase